MADKSQLTLNQQTVGEIKTKATTLYASGCTGLSKLNAPKATTLDANGCTGLSKLNAPKANYLDASGCTGLSKLNAPKATRVYRGEIRWFWHIHHEILVEMEAEPIEERREYIRHEKPNHEISTRLRLLKEVANQELVSKLVSENNQEELNKLHAAECPDCPWNGKTIFPREL